MDFTATAGGTIACAMFAIALVSILRATGLGGLAKLAWVLVALVLPIIGPILWFAVGKRYPHGINGGNG